MEENLTQQLVASHERLAELKHRRKVLRNDLKEACERYPQWDEAMQDKKSAAYTLKGVRDTAAEETGIGADLAEIKENIALEEDIIAGTIEQLIASGQVKMGVTQDVGGLTIEPKMKVNLNAQLKLAL